jgi:putative ABC transport system permease protein
MYTLPLRLRSIFRRSQVERDLDDELQFHLEQRIAHEIAGGRTPEDAHHAARRAMDGLDQRKEECRDMRRVNYIDNLLRDLRYAVRTLSRTPAFTIAAVLALALGIGANTAVFSVVNGVLLRPLPYGDPDRLVMVYDSFQQQGMERGPGCIADFLDWKARNHSFQSIDAVAGNRFTLMGDGEAEQIVGTSVTATFFDTLGARPLFGRTFSRGDDQPGRPQTVVLSERLWRRRYSANPNILGKEILLNGRSHTVLGVMPSTFQFGPRMAEVWTSLALNPPGRRGPFFVQGIARLKPGVTIQAAAVEMNSIAKAVERENPKAYGQLRFPVVGLRETVVGDVQPLLLVLTGAVLLVFMIAVSNVANLMLARAAARHREIAIRLSIGAGRGQLVRQFMTESLLLSLVGGALGVALAVSGVAILRVLNPRELPRIAEIAVDARVLIFTLLVSLASALIFGLAPALSASRTPPGDSLKETGRAGESRGRGRARGVLVVAQVAFSLLLLIGAGLLIRSFTLLSNVGPGFQAPPDRVLTMLLLPTGPKYRDPVVLRGYWTQLIDRVGTLPGVESASVSLCLPPDRISFTDGYEIEGQVLPPGIDNPAVPVSYVSSDFFKTLEIPLKQGRWFENRDHADAPRVAVISEAFARKHFTGENPLGRRLKHGGRNSQGTFMEIVGIVGDVKYEGLESEMHPAFYEAADQQAARPMWLLVRTRGEASALTGAIRAEIRGLDPAVLVDSVATAAQVLADSVSLPRFRSLLMSIFAGTALLMAAIGIYGVIAYTVAQRTHEIGVRMALGATPTGVLRLVIGQSGRVTLIGIVLGVAGALSLTRVLKTMLFNITPFDTLTFASAVFVLGAVAVVASLAPALRASRVDPVTALHHE